MIYVCRYMLYIILYIMTTPSKSCSCDEIASCDHDHLPAFISPHLNILILNKIFESSQRCASLGLIRKWMKQFSHVPVGWLYHFSFQKFSEDVVQGANIDMSSLLQYSEGQNSECQIGKTASLYAGLFIPRRTEGCTLVKNGLRDVFSTSITLTFFLVCRGCFWKDSSHSLIALISQYLQY